MLAISLAIKLGFLLFHVLFCYDLRLYYNNSGVILTVSNTHFVSVKLGGNAETREQLCILLGIRQGFLLLRALLSLYLIFPKQDFMRF